jgi:hypothetical protein
LLIGSFTVFLEKVFVRVVDHLGYFRRAYRGSGVARPQ